jgi:hypothetical protein
MVDLNMEIEGLQRQAKEQQDRVVERQSEIARVILGTQDLREWIASRASLREELKRELRDPPPQPAQVLAVSTLSAGASRNVSPMGGEEGEIRRTSSTLVL